ncbi:MAG: sulfurtransferase [Solirubrobacteraceae bacterium]
MIGPVVDAAWLRARLGEVVVADVRWYLDGRSGRAAYDAGHLPGAVFVDLDAVLTAPASVESGRHPLPDAEHFARAIGALGIEDGSVVVAYDDAGGTVAARLVWMLRALGEPAALLDGGIGAWDGPLSTEAAAPPPGAFTARPWPAALLASADDAGDPANRVLDARAGERYRGEVEPVDAQAGHIPGAVNVPARSLLDDDGRFLAPAVLRERLAGADVAYCGSGVTACHVLLAIEHAGLPPARLYPGSWSQWSGDPTRPVARGAARARAPGGP